MLGLPDGITACLFDLDGVLTQTAKVHAAAWTQMFDAFLRQTQGEGAAPFNEHDYDAYVDGKTRSDGVRSFLDSRGIAHDEEDNGNDEEKRAGDDDRDRAPAAPADQ